MNMIVIYSEFKKQQPKNECISLAILHRVPRIFPINSDYYLISSLSRSGRIHATEDKKHAQLKINTAADDNHVTANKTNHCF